MGRTLGWGFITASGQDSFFKSNLNKSYTFHWLRRMPIKIVEELRQKPKGRKTNNQNRGNRRGGKTLLKLKPKPAYVTPITASIQDKEPLSSTCLFVGENVTHSRNHNHTISQRHPYRVRSQCPHAIADDVMSCMGHLSFGDGPLQI